MIPLPNICDAFLVDNGIASGPWQPICVPQPICNPQQTTVPQSPPVPQPSLVLQPSVSFPCTTSRAHCPFLRFATYGILLLLMLPNDG